MKLKFPKEVVIGNTTFKVVCNKSYSGGHFYYNHKEKGTMIEIGTERINDQPLWVFNTIVHETLEIIYEEHGGRFESRLDNSYMFNFGHSEFAVSIHELVRVLDQFIVWEK